MRSNEGMWVTLQVHFSQPIAQYYQTYNKYLQNNTSMQSNKSLSIHMDTIEYFLMSSVCYTVTGYPKKR